MAKHAVVRTDLMYGTDVRSGLVSVKYMGSDGGSPTALDNGRILRVGDLIDGEREVYEGADVKADTPIDEVVLVASVEVMYDARKRGLDEYFNEAEHICRGYRLHAGDIFSVTKEALGGNDAPSVGDVVELKDGTMLNVVSNATAGSTAVGNIIAVENASGFTFYVISVDGTPEVSGGKSIKIPDKSNDKPGGITGRTVGDLIGDDVQISWNGVNGYVTGSLKKVTGWTEFDESDPTGHFFPISLDERFKNKTIVLQGSKRVEAKDTEWVIKVDKAKVFTILCEGETIAVLDFNRATFE